ncbi:MAG TPA: response regulator transcription factor, partial [Acidimicrobiales bacterium]
RAAEAPTMQSAGHGLVLVVEDERAIADLISLYLRRDGFGVQVVGDGRSALTAVRTQRPVAVVLDVGLPGMDGIEVCRALRAADDWTPVLFVTARDDEVDRVLGLELGADDYVTKPFSPRELVARVKAILRRVDGPPRDEPNVLVAGGVEVDLGRREARLDGRVVPLAAREFDLLAHLAHNAGLALTRPQLLEGVWGSGWYGDERTVDVHVRQLRKKLGDQLPLATVWGVGYRLD